MARKIALLIGVGEYGEGLDRLQCPENGVAALQSILENREIGEFDEVIALLNPSVSDMRKQIVEVFAGRSKEDLVLLYFTGHGVKDLYGNFYLTTTESYLLEDGQINAGTAVEGEFVESVLSRCNAERKVVILDCCFAAAFIKGTVSMDDSSIDIKGQLGTRELGEKGCCVLTASTSTRYALEQEGETLSVYTRYLTEGLRTGGAALDGKSFISAKHLHDYVKAQVKVAAPAMNPAKFSGIAGDEIVIAKAYVDNEQRYRKQVQAVVKRFRGRLRPSAKGSLKLSQNDLGIADELAAAILAEVLKPYEEKAKHVAFYKQILQEEKDYGYPLDAEAIEELQRIKRRLNLRDEDVRTAETAVLGAPLASSVIAAHEPPRATQTLPATTPLQYPTFSFETVRVNEVGKVIETISGEAECYTEDLGDGVTLEMLRIPGGKFMMGAAQGEEGANDDEYPQHEVTVPEFWMGKYVVTQAQWHAVAKLKKVERDLQPDPAHFKGEQQPVETVSWEEAVEFCKRLSQRSKWTYALPSEAQWEYACRARSITPFHFGPTITTDLANYQGTDWSYQRKTYPGNYGRGPRGKYRGKTVAVGSFSPNIFGLYDMHGNVWEWCLDSWHDSYKRSPSDGSAWQGSSEERKVLRGGSWVSIPWYCRVAYRYWDPRDYRDVYIGFRVCFIAPRTPK